MISRDIFHSSIGQNDTFDAFTFLLFIFVIFPCISSRVYLVSFLRFFFPEKKNQGKYEELSLK